MTTLSKAVQLFLGEYQTRPATQRSYDYDLRAMLRFVGGDRHIDQIEPIHLLEYSQELLRRLHAGEGIKSPHTYNKLIKSLKAFFNWSVRMKLIAESPAKHVRREKTRRGVNPNRVMPEAVYQQLCARVAWDARAHALVLFLGDSGSRIGGAAGLRWDDLDLDAGTAITVQKGKPPQTVYFGADCRVALRHWYRLQTPKRRGPFVFSRNGQRMTNDSLGQYFTRWCERAGLKTYGPHSLRHRLGFRAVKDNVPIPVLAAILGDTVAVTLESYAHIDEKDVQNAVRRLSSRGQFGPISPLVDDEECKTG